MKKGKAQGSLAKFSRESLLVTGQDLVGLQEPQQQSRCTSTCNSSAWHSQPALAWWALGQGRLWPNRLAQPTLAKPTLAKTSLICCVFVCLCVCCVVCCLCGVGTFSRCQIGVSCVGVGSSWFGPPFFGTALPWPALPPGPPFPWTALPHVHIWALGLSCETPAAPPDRAAGARTRQPENSKRAHLRVPVLKTPPKFNEKTPREGRTNLAAGGEKSAKLWVGLHPSGPPTLRALGLAPGLHEKNLQLKITKN